MGFNGFDRLRALRIAVGPPEKRDLFRQHYGFVSRVAT